MHRCSLVAQMPDVADEANLAFGRLLRSDMADAGPARRARGPAQTPFSSLRLTRQRDVARRRLVPSRRDADHRLIDLLSLRPIE
jgi:hypothetical protein